MKILFLSDPSFETEELIFYRDSLCQELVRSGHSVQVLIKGFFYPIRVIMSARNADLVYSCNLPSLRLAATWTSKLLKKKLIVKITSDYVWEKAISKGETFFLINDFQKANKSNKLNKEYGLQKDFCNLANLVIAPSDFLASIAVGWGVDKTKVKTISDSSHFVPSQMTKEEARKMIFIPGNLLVSAGNLVSWRGFRMLVKIMPQLLEMNQFFRLIIIGDGPDRKFLESMVKNLNLDRRVYVVGKKSDQELASYLAAADMFILNTSHENFPSQVLKAMSAGVPIVTTAVGSNPELIKQGENGFMVKYNDEFNLIEAIKTLWKNPELAKHFVEEGKKTFSKFNSTELLQETTKILSM